jgi:hypothetical protein
MNSIKTLLITISLIFYSFSSFSQVNIKQFYIEKNKAITEYTLDKDTSKLLTFYKYCLDKYPATFLKNVSFDRDEGFVMACSFGDLDIADVLFRNALTTGLGIGNVEYYQTDTVYKPYFDSNKGKKTLLESDSLLREYNLKLDIVWLSNISSMMGSDQFARLFIHGGNEAYYFGLAFEKFNFLGDSLRKKVEREAMALADSLNFDVLVYAIETRGFPSPTKARGGLGPLAVHHFIEKSPRISKQGKNSFLYLDSVYLAAVYAGECSNSNYAFLKDYAISSGRGSDNPRSLYGSSVNVGRGKHEIMDPIVDIKNVDKRRADIFLPPLWVDAILWNFELPEDYVR